MKILLLGANGQLGRTFIRDGGLSARGDMVLASRDGTLSEGGQGEIADLSKPDSLPGLLDRVQPELIVNAAAYTAVDRAENEETLANTINGEAVAMLGHWSAKHSALVVHYSTDYVFDGRQATPYTTDAPTGPVGAYGRSKLAGEQALAESGAGHLIFRTAWVYAAHGSNFLRTMLRLGNVREELSVVADQHGSPTDTSLIVRASLAAIDRWYRLDSAERKQLPGIHHLVASGVTSWYGFATAIFEQAAALGLLRRQPRVLPVATSEFPTPAARPAWSVLDNRDFQQHFGVILPDWRLGLSDVMRRLANTER